MSTGWVVTDAMRPPAAPARKAGVRIWSRMDLGFCVCVCSHWNSYGEKGVGDGFKIKFYAK